MTKTDWTAGAGALALMAGLATLAPTQALAQSQTPAVTDLGEVVVVARRTEERLQSVPLAVTAISSETLENRNVQTGLDLQRLVPTLSVQQSNLNAGPGFSLRGIRSGVLSYFNEVPVGTSGVDLQIWDLASIQAVPGPQGTLFGQNSTGGAILFVPQAPTPNFDGYVEASVGNYNAREATGVVNIPFSDKVQLRLGARITKRDGVVENISGRDLQSQDRQAYRASLMLKPTDWLSNYTVVDYAERDETSYGIIAQNLVLRACPPGPLTCLYGANAQLLGEQQRLLGIRKINSPFPEYLTDKPLGVSNVLTADLGPVTLKYIAGYRRNEFGQKHNANSLPLPIAVAEAGQKNTTRTHEFQASGSLFDERLDWIGGVFLNSFKGNSYLGYTLLQPLGTQPSLAASQISGSITDNEQKAAYAQATFAVTDQMKVTAGIRRTVDEPSQLAQSLTPGFRCAILALPGTDPVTCRRPLSAKFEATTYNLSVDYQITPDFLVYAAHRKGYNTGGFNGSFNDPALVPIRPEYIKDYEAGLKADWRLGDVPIRTNAAIFYAKYEDIQRGGQKIVNGFTFSGIFNAAEATIYGMQLEVTARPTPNLLLTGSYGYLNSKYDSFENSLLGNATGNKFAQAPEQTLNLSASYTHPLPTGELVANVSYAYQSEVTFSDNNVGSEFAFQKGYGLVDLRLDWKGVANQPIDLGLFVKNATDEDYAVYIIDQRGTFGFTSNSYGDPRTYGVQLRYRFGARAEN